MKKIWQMGISVQYYGITVAESYNKEAFLQFWIKRGK